jgi:hypothetical protein
VHGLRELRVLIHSLWTLLRHPILTFRVMSALRKDLKGLSLEDKAQRARLIEAQARQHLADIQDE